MFVEKTFYHRIVTLFLPYLYVPEDRCETLEFVQTCLYVTFHGDPHSIQHVCFASVMTSGALSAEELLLEDNVRKWIVDIGSTVPGDAVDEG